MVQLALFQSWLCEQARRLVIAHITHLFIRELMLDVLKELKSGNNGPILIAFGHLLAIRWVIQLKGLEAASLSSGRSLIF